MKVKNVSLKLSEKMFKVVLEMCSARCYTIESVVYDATNPDSAQNEHIIASDGKQRIYIFLRLVSPTLALEVFNNMIRTVRAQRITHAVIFYDKKTPSVKETDAEINVELIEIDRIHFNPNAHVLSPVYRKLTPEECAEFKKGSVLQIMQGKDAIAVFNGYRKNDIIEITRKNGYVDYRIVKGVAYKLIELSDSEEEDEEGDEEGEDEGDEEGEEDDEEYDDDEGEEEESDGYDYE